MHAVVVRVSINDLEPAQQMLGTSMVVFESEEAAQGMAGQLQEMPPSEAVAIDSVEVREVVASA